MKKNPWIRLKKAIPGPKAQLILQQDQRYTSPSYTRPYPLVADKALGMVVTDVDGNQFLDFSAGIASCSTGHCHPRIVHAIQHQAAQLIHLSGTDFRYPQFSELAQKLAELTPGPAEKRVSFGNSGTEAVEGALKLARYTTGRSRFVAFYNAFHGRTLGSLSLTASKPVQRRGFGPLLEGVTHVPYPYCYRCPMQEKLGECNPRCLDYLEEVVFQSLLDPREVAAIVFEPILGEGGYVVPPAEFFAGLKRLSERYGILLIADEVQTGMGRTGRMFGVEHFQTEPDIICLAKGIASGMPLGATVAKAELMTWEPGAHASTFGGNPLSCVAALETIQLLQEGLVDNAAQMGTFLLRGLTELAERHPLIGDVRGKGLMIGAELVKSREAKEAAVQWRDQLIQMSFEKGLLLLGCGESTVRLMPPLIVNQEQAQLAIEILDQVLSELEKAQGISPASS